MVKRITLVRLATILFVVAAIAIFFLAGLYRQFDWLAIRGELNTLQAWVRENNILAVFLFTAMYVALTSLSLPVSAVLSLTAGALFGRWAGTAVVSFASTAGATLAFLGSRFLFREWVERLSGARLRAIQNGVAKEGAWYLLTLRLVPLFPF